MYGIVVGMVVVGLFDRLDEAAQRARVDSKRLQQVVAFEEGNPTARIYFGQLLGAC